MEGAKSHSIGALCSNLRSIAGAAARLAVLMALAFVGGSARTVFHLPLPGPVAGLVLLSSIALLIERLQVSSSRRLMNYLAPVGRLLLSHMGLFFVPAGVGIATMADVLRGEWLPVAAALVGSTVLSLATTALVMDYVARRK